VFNYHNTTNTGQGREQKLLSAFFVARTTERGILAMAVFRIEKTQNYTVMSNHHLVMAVLTVVL